MFFRYTLSLSPAPTNCTLIYTCTRFSPSIPKHQACHSAPVNKRQVIFLGMGVTKSNLEGRWRVSWVWLGSFPLFPKGNWHPDQAMVSAAPTEEPKHLSTAAQVTSQNDSWAGRKTTSTWLTECSKMTTGLQVLNSGSVELEHRKVAGQEREGPQGPPYNVI